MDFFATTATSAKAFWYDTVPKDVMVAACTVLSRIFPAVFVRNVLEYLLTDFVTYAARILSKFRFVSDRHNLTGYLGESAMLLRSEHNGLTFNHGIVGTIFETDFADLAIATDFHHDQFDHHVAKLCLLTDSFQDAEVADLQDALQSYVWMSSRPFATRFQNEFRLPYVAIMAGMTGFHRFYHEHLHRDRPEWAARQNSDLFVALGLLLGWQSVGLHEVEENEPLLLQVLEIVLKSGQVELMSKFKRCCRFQMRSPAFWAKAVQLIVESGFFMELPSCIPEELLLQVFRPYFERRKYTLQINFLLARESDRYSNGFRQEMRRLFKSLL